jgi:hypothetical protein
VLRLHSLSYSDHVDGGSGRTADEWVSTPSPASESMLAGDSLSSRVRSVHDGTTPKGDAGIDGRLFGITEDSRAGSTTSLLQGEQLLAGR